jgi:hypothetical protein
MHPLIAHEWLYGLTECLHILGFTLAIGSVALVDLHLLGWGFSNGTTADVVRQTGPWTNGGIALAVLTGLVILSTDPGRYLLHPVMRAKFITLGFAIVYNGSVHAPIARGTPSRGVAVAVAGLSLLLWTSLVFDGIAYAFT